MRLQMTQKITRRVFRRLHLLFILKYSALWPLFFTIVWNIVTCVSWNYSLINFTRHHLITIPVSLPSITVKWPICRYMAIYQTLYLLKVLNSSNTVLNLHNTRLNPLKYQGIHDSSQVWIQLCAQCPGLWTGRGWQRPSFITNLLVFQTKMIMFTGLLALEYHDLDMKSGKVCNKTRSPPAWALNTQL